MTRAPALVFAVLVAATFGAFFLAQRLKNAPTVIGSFRATPVFSPNGDGRNDAAHVSFTVKRRDRVTVTVVNADGDRVRELLDLATRHNVDRVRATWDGRADDGRRAPDGIYRYRITLRDQGRGVVFPRAVTLDTKPPQPRVTSIGERSPRPQPEIVPAPQGGDTTITVSARGTRPRVLLFRTSPAPRLVGTLDVPPPDGPHGRYVKPFVVRWDGTVDGRAARQGTYAVVVEVRDAAGNIGTSAPLGAGGLPRAPYGAAFPGRGGITVRYIGAEPPAEPVEAGRPIVVGVDSRTRPFSWRLRRIGAKGGRGGRSSRPSADGTVDLVARTKRSGVFLFSAHTDRHATTVPVAIQAGGPQKVLVVLPVMTWQGRNPQDDDGDGAPNLLDHGDGVRLHRIYAGDGLPEGFAEVTAPLLGWLDATGRRYDVTTDLALARGEGPRLSGHTGVLVAGDARWLPAAVQNALRRFVDDGGTLATAGVDSLRCQVRLTPRDRLIDPTPAATFDALGLRPAPLVRGDALVLTNARDDAALFAGSSGQLRGFTLAEPLQGVRGGRVLSSAVVGDDNRVVVAAVRVGKGLTVHLGLPELPAHLGRRAKDPDAVALMERTWTLLSR